MQFCLERLWTDETEIQLREFLDLALFVFYTQKNKIPMVYFSHCYIGNDKKDILNPDYLIFKKTFFRIFAAP